MEDILMYARFGSHLYGTDTPQSDEDFKGVFMPGIDDILLGRVPRSINTNTKKGSDKKNTKDDTDKELYTLHYFIKLACAGETGAIDMLHTPDDTLIETSDIWSYIRDNRRRFYCKNMRAAVGYARGQAAKYGIKGSRLGDAKRVIEFLEKQDDKLILQDVWDDLPVGEHIRKDDEWYEVCNRKFIRLSRIGYDLEIIRKFYSNYGKRAEMAMNNEGIDWKAISHALRVCYQMLSIIEQGDIFYPLEEADYLKRVKLGELEYKEVGQLLESLVDDVIAKAEASNLPDKVDVKFWDDFIINSIYKYYNLIAWR